jgi:hypothetical protein
MTTGPPLLSIVVVGPGGSVVMVRSVVAVGSTGTPGPRAIPVSSSISKGASLVAVGATSGRLVVVTTGSDDKLFDDGEQLAKISALNDAAASNSSEREPIIASAAAQQ